MEGLKTCAVDCIDIRGCVFIFLLKLFGKFPERPCRNIGSLELTEHQASNSFE